MRINLKSKKVLALGVAAVTVISGGAAYAYWTAGGAGTGTAATDAGTIALTVNQAALTEMYPGDSAQTISGTFGNTNDGPVYVTSVTASIASVTEANTDTTTSCTAADYTLSLTTMTVNAEVAVGDPIGAWSGATIQFNNTDANQDACKGATVNLAYSVV